VTCCLWSRHLIYFKGKIKKTVNQGDNESMNNIISHYLYYLDLLGVGREEAGPHEVLSCAQQVAFNPSTSSSP
jgi:hypothetical protein